MAMLNYFLIFGAIAFAVVVLAVVALKFVGGKLKSPPSVARIAAAPLAQRASMFDALDAGGPGAQAKIEAAMVDYAIRQKLKDFSAATAPLMADPSPVPNPPPASATTH